VVSHAYVYRIRRLALSVAGNAALKIEKLHASLPGSEDADAPSIIPLSLMYLFYLRFGRMFKMH